MTDWPAVPKELAPTRDFSVRELLPENDAQIKKLWRKDVPIPMIAAELGVTVPTMRLHLQRLGLMDRRA